jgi:hypothetical protein
MVYTGKRVLRDIEKIRPQNTTRKDKETKIGEGRTTNKDNQKTRQEGWTG